MNDTQNLEHLVIEHLFWEYATMAY